LITAIRPHMNATTFVTWASTGSDIPVRWNTAREQINRQARDR
jgi:hypothetical protein